MIGSDTVGRRRWSRSVRFQGRRADSGEMAARGACDREIQPSRLMFFLSPIVEVQPGNVNVANFLQFRSTTSPWRAADAGERDGRTKEVCYVIYGTWLGPGISLVRSSQLEERR